MESYRTTAGTNVGHHLMMCIGRSQWRTLVNKCGAATTTLVCYRRMTCPDALSRHLRTMLTVETTDATDRTCDGH